MSDRPRGASAAGEGLSVSPWTPERIEILKALFQAGHSAEVIGRELGLSRNSVGGKLLRLGLHRNGTQRRARSSYRRPGEATSKPLAERSIKGAPEPLMLSLLDLVPTSCRFPIGDPAESGFGFCGHERRPGSSFCPVHHAACILPPDRTFLDGIDIGSIR